MGMTNTMPKRRSTVRGSHFGKLRGHRSSQPNISSIAVPTNMARNRSTGRGTLLLIPNSNPKAPDTASVNRSRGHAKMRLKPVGVDGAVDSMAGL